MKIAVLTSGGDAPGLNACIRAVIRASSYYNITTLGIKGGYEGMIKGDFVPMDASSVSNIIHLGGTILKSSRSERFKTKEGRKQAYDQLNSRGIEAMILLGGDGTFKGAQVFVEEYPDIRIIGVPKTIDNDLSGTDYCIGYDTALNTVMSAVDKIRDTAESHKRIFVVEVMGRDAGYIAYGSGLASGAEGILIPETSADISHLKENFAKGWDRKKSSLIIIVAEGDENGGGYETAKRIKEFAPENEVRVCVLGYIQRGGSPSAFDRILAAKLGVTAIEYLLEGKSNILVGSIKNEITSTPLQEAVKRNMPIDNNSLKFLEILTS